MFFTKVTLAAIFALGLALSACNTKKTTLTSEEQTRLQEQKALPKTLQIEPGSYSVTVECVDAAKTEKLKNLHWVVTFKSENQYLESQQNFDANCEDACSAVEAGSVKINEAQAVFTVTHKMNTKSEFEPVAAATSKTYFLMTYDRVFDKLTLIDNEKTNVCQGKMILTLQK